MTAPNILKQCIENFIQTVNSYESVYLSNKDNMSLEQLKDFGDTLCRYSLEHELPIIMALQDELLQKQIPDYLLEDLNKSSKFIDEVCNDIMPLLEFKSMQENGYEQTEDFKKESNKIAKFLSDKVIEIANDIKKSDSDSFIFLKENIDGQ